MRTHPPRVILYLSESLKHDGINVEFTINSGQLFLWKRHGEFWYGINGQNVLKCDSTRVVKLYEPKEPNFFRTYKEHKRIVQSISKDKIMKDVVARYAGLCVPRQDPFQCYLSFIASANSNIQKIRTCLESICSKFGDVINFDGILFHLFPEPDTIADADIDTIRRCGLGYRAKYIKQAASMVTDGKIDFEELKSINYFDAKQKLCTVPGIGNKVADCILLFSLDKSEAFPLDRWMIRVLQRHYPSKFDIKNKTLTDKQYNILHKKIVEYFGPYAGHAQQFLFKMEREDSGGRWTKVKW